MQLGSILVTGGRGMLGRTLTEMLLSRGLDAMASDLPELDITDPQMIAATFAARSPAVVINCAAFTNVDGCESSIDKANAINGHAVGHLATACREVNATLVHLSTDFVFDGAKREMPYRTDDAVGPLSAYGKSKLLGETELQRHAPSRWMIVRTAWLYGRHGANFPRTMVTAARAGKPLSVVCDQVGAPTYTVDLAAAILNLLEAEAQGIFHVTNAGQTNWCDFAQATMKAFGVEKEVAAITSADWAKIKPNAAHRPSYSVMDLSRYELLTGRKMRPWQLALAEYAAAVARDGF